MDYPRLDELQIEHIRNALLPASKELIVTMLVRMAMHKRMDADPSKQAIFYGDCADVLFGVSEYALALTVVHFIETDVSPWFPTLAAIRLAVDEETVHGVFLDPALDNAGQGTA